MTLSSSNKDLMPRADNIRPFLTFFKKPIDFYVNFIYNKYMKSEMANQSKGWGAKLQS